MITAGAIDSASDDVEPAIVKSQSYFETGEADPQTDQVLEREYPIIISSFTVLLLFSSWLVAFAHGANDVSNAIGPFAAIESILDTDTVDSTEPIPFWVLGLGGGGLCLGLALLGHRVMQTVGNDITKVTIINGFCVQFGTAVTILIASYLGLPVSTTHTIIGSLLGVGVVEAGLKSLQMKVW